MDSNCITLIFSGIVAISTVFYVILTGKLVKETRIMRKSQIEPHIIAYLDVAESMADIVFLKIKNIGTGVAKNVVFTIIKDINYKEAIPLKDFGYFTDGIAYFPPSHEDKFLIFSLQQGNTEEKLNDFITVKIGYHNIFDEFHETTFDLKFKEVMGKSDSTPPDSYLGQVAFRLKNIEKLIEKNINKNEVKH